MVNKYLLDTQTLLWWLEDNRRFKKDIKAIVANEENQVFVSVISFWEISIKNKIGKLPMKTTLNTVIRESKFSILEVKSDHILTLNSLPPIHKDPFDRVLIAQAKTEKLKLITSDPKIWKYKISVLKT